MLPSAPDILARGPSSMEVDAEDVCWICLDDPSPSGHALLSPCRCPRKVHPKCLARWQLQQAGRPEETHCRFCNSTLADWKVSLTPDNLKPDVKKVQPVMVVYFEGEIHRIPVKQGPDGLTEFTGRIRELFRLPDEVDISLTFGCKEPMSGTHLKLEGMGAFDAAVHCASVAAADRQSKQRDGSAGGDAAGALPTAGTGTAPADDALHSAPSAAADEPALFQNETPPASFSGLAAPAAPQLPWRSGASDPRLDPAPLPPALQSPGTYDAGVDDSGPSVSEPVPVPECPTLTRPGHARISPVQSQLYLPQLPLAAPIAVRRAATAAGAASAAPPASAFPRARSSSRPSDELRSTSSSDLAPGTPPSCPPALVGPRVSTLSSLSRSTQATPPAALPAARPSSGAGRLALSGSGAFAPLAVPASAMHTASSAPVASSSVATPRPFLELLAPSAVSGTHSSGAGAGVERVDDVHGNDASAAAAAAATRTARRMRRSGTRVGEPEVTPPSSASQLELEPESLSGRIKTGFKAFGRKVARSLKFSSGGKAGGTAGDGSSSYSPSGTPRRRMSHQEGAGPAAGLC